MVCWKQYLLILLFINDVYSYTITLPVLIMAPSETRYPFSLKKLRTAGEMALQTVQQRRLLPHNLIFQLDEVDTGCDGTQALSNLIRYMSDKNRICSERNYNCSESITSASFSPLTSKTLLNCHKPLVLFGPVCTYAASQVLRFNSVLWHRPSISIGAMSSVFSKRTESSEIGKQYRYLTRSGITFDPAIKLLIAALRYYNFRRFVFVYSGLNPMPYQESAYCMLFKNSLSTGYAKEIFGKFHIERVNLADFREKLVSDTLKRRIGNKVSAVTLCAHPDYVRKFMIKAHDLNFVSGEYVFFNIDSSSSKKEVLRPWYRSDSSPEDNAKARKAFRSVLTVTLKTPATADYRRFSQLVKRRMKESYNYDFGDEEVSSYVGAFHDSVILYALALNDTLTQKKSITDSVAITRNMWNRSFSGITGVVSINANGDRSMDYSLMDMNPNTGMFETVAYYYGTRDQLVPVVGKAIDWVNPEQKPPPDTPRCGFDGSRCRKYEKEIERGGFFRSGGSKSGVITAQAMAGCISVALILGLSVDL